MYRFQALRVSQLQTKLRYRCEYNYHSSNRILIHRKKALEEAEELKREGNDYFRASEWTEALVAYRTALGRLPKRQNPQPSPGGSNKPVNDPDEDTSPPDEGSSDQQSAQPAQLPEAELTPLQFEYAKARSVLNANVAACHMKLVCPTYKNFPGTYNG